MKSIEVPAFKDATLRSIPSQFRHNSLGEARMTIANKNTNAQNTGSKTLGQMLKERMVEIQQQEQGTMATRLRAALGPELQAELHQRRSKALNAWAQASNNVSRLQAELKWAQRDLEKAKASLDDIEEQLSATPEEPEVVGIEYHACGRWIVVVYADGTEEGITPEFGCRVPRKAWDRFKQADPIAHQMFRDRWEAAYDACILQLKEAGL